MFLLSLDPLLEGNKLQITIEQKILYSHAKWNYTKGPGKFWFVPSGRCCQLCWQAYIQLIICKQQKAFHLPKDIDNI